jgi:hypothetical protein
MATDARTSRIGSLVPEPDVTPHCERALANRKS